MKKIILLIIIVVACSKPLEEMNYVELDEAKNEGIITVEQYDYYKNIIDKENAAEAKVLWTKWKKLAKTKNISDEDKTEYLKKANLWRKRTKQWTLPADEFKQFVQDSIYNIEVER